MRISDWSSDVCSSDLARADAARRTTDVPGPPPVAGVEGPLPHRLLRLGRQPPPVPRRRRRDPPRRRPAREERKSVVAGKSVAVRVDLGGRRFIKKKKLQIKQKK